MNATARTRLFAQLRALSLVFGCVVLGNLEFVEHAQPIPETTLVPASHVIATVALLILLPTVLLFVADRLIFAIRGESAQRLYRGVLLGLTVFFIARQLHLYNDFAGGFTSLVTPGGAAGLVIGGALAAAAVWACYRWQSQVATFFQYMGPAALVLLFISVLNMTPDRIAPETYANTVSHEAKSEAGPVFVLVFDELSYDVLTEDGELDRESFPNFARLADDGAWFTNATTSYHQTRYVVPSMFTSMELLTEEYELWAYPQYAFVESLVWDGCGTQYTCRGTYYRASENAGEMVGYTTEKWLDEVLPGPFARAAATPLDMVFGDLGNPPVQADPTGLQSVTKAHWDGFLADISGVDSRGRAYLFHTMLPHYPFVFDAEGNATSSARHTDFEVDPESDETYENYRLQTMYADRKLGEFLDRLEAESLYEDAVIVATGDHGLRRVDPPELETIEVDPEMAHVPLLIKAPAVDPAVLDLDYQTVDFGPTLMDLVGWPVEGWSGVSAFAGERPDREKVLYVGEEDLRYWKFVYDAAQAEWVLVDEAEGRLTGIAQAAATPDSELVSR